MSLNQSSPITTLGATPEAGTGGLYTIPCGRANRTGIELTLSSDFAGELRFVATTKNASGSASVENALLVSNAQLVERGMVADSTTIVDVNTTVYRQLSLDYNGITAGTVDVTYSQDYA